MRKSPPLTQARRAATETQHTRNRRGPKLARTPAAALSALVVLVIAALPLEVRAQETGSCQVVGAPLPEPPAAATASIEDSTLLEPGPPFHLRPIPVATGANIQDGASIVEMDLPPATSGYFVVWSETAPGSSASAIRGRFVDDHGNPAVTTLTLASSTVGRASAPKIARYDFGANPGLGPKYELVWVEPNGQVSRETYCLSQPCFPCCVSYTLDRYNLYAMALAEDGTPWSAPVLLSDKVIPFGDPASAFQVTTAFSAGGAIVSWLEPRGGTIPIAPLLYAAQPSHVVMQQVDVAGVWGTAQTVVPTAISLFPSTGDSGAIPVLYGVWRGYTQDYDVDVTLLDNLTWAPLVHHNLTPLPGPQGSASVTNSAPGVLVAYRDWSSGRIFTRAVPLPPVGPGPATPVSPPALNPLLTPVLLARHGPWFLDHPFHVVSGTNSGVFFSQLDQLGAFPVVNNVRVMAFGSPTGIAARHVAYPPPENFGIVFTHRSDVYALLLPTDSQTLPLADSDGDGLPDDWEQNGLDTNGDGVVDVPLPLMGASPLHVDVFVEVDSALGHELKPEAALEVTLAFDRAPNVNLDGTTGIHLHIDAGPWSIMRLDPPLPWGPLSRWFPLPVSFTLGSCEPISGSSPPQYQYVWDAFDNLKNQYFESARRYVFHYAILAHDSPPLCHVLGLSRALPASDFFITPGTNPLFQIAPVQAAVFMHELGHNLGLDHGGFDKIPDKPNYVSIMNPQFRFGVIKNGIPWTLDYSRFDVTLDERSLDENVGLGSSASWIGTNWRCFGAAPNFTFDASRPIDWNCDATISPGRVMADVGGALGLQTLLGWNDWAKLVFEGGSIGAPFDMPQNPPATVLVDEPSEDEMAEVVFDYAVGVTGPPEVEATPGLTRLVDFSVTNHGARPDRYGFTVTSAEGWSPGAPPANIGLQPGATAIVQVSVRVPAGTPPGTVGRVSLSARSQNDSRFADSASAVVVPARAPVANAGPDQTVECALRSGARVTLDGTASQSPGGAPLTYRWTGPFPEGQGTVSGARPQVTLPLGASVVRLVVSDGVAESAADEVAVTVRDTTAPEILVTLSPSSLVPPAEGPGGMPGPPDSDMRDIVATVRASDLCGPFTAASLISVTSSEPDDAPGPEDGHTINDIQEVSPGTPDFTFRVRAARATPGPGRIYTAEYEATDRSGNRARGQATVRVE